MSEENYAKIENHIEEITNPKDIAYLYNKNFVNWRGPTTPDKEKSFYTDYIAKKLLAELNIDTLFAKISSSNRDNYFIKEHDGVTHKHTNRTEEMFAKSLLRHRLKNLGKIIGYQMPLKDKQSDKYGKVDLVSFREDDSTAFLIELKMAEKKETLLRAALEVATYRHIIEKDKLKKYLAEKEERFGITKPNDLKIEKAVLFAVNEKDQPKELLPKNKNYYKNLWDLLAKLNIGVYTIPYTYPVEEHHNPWK